ncbi:DNA polymerase III subunit beta [uncultured Paraglaciecola sp.]|uniref:DNA polymerase III subunit beta n=1 Tax=uncultured Paraglaciecola sp. TaxID=1765024 RepID=UPI00261D62ED|nr:DNA polymerase III subunit beta [uncultured Paraglaciecola sp.]
MQITAQANVLREALKPHTHVIEKANTIPILFCVRLKLKKGRLLITCTDLNMYLETDCDLSIGDGDSDTFDVCTNLAPLLAVITSMKTDAVMIQSTNDLQLVLSAPGVKCILPALPPSDFPEADLDRPWLYRDESFDNGEFISHLRDVLDTVSTEETRYYLNGIHWLRDKKSSYMESTDGHRLTRRIIEKEDGLHPVRVSAIMPTKACKVLSAVMPTAIKVRTHYLEEKDKAGSTIARPEYIKVSGLGVRLLYRLIDAQYPNTNRVIPDYGPSATSLTTNREAWLEAAEAAMLFNKSLNRQTRYGRSVKIETNSYGDTEVSVESIDMGSVRRSLRITANNVEPKQTYKIGFNSKYLLNTIKACTGSTLTIRQEDIGSPCRFDDGDDNTIRIVMPMRVE